MLRILKKDEHKAFLGTNVVLEKWLAGNGNHGVEESPHDLLVVDVKEPLVEGHWPEIGGAAAATLTPWQTFISWKGFNFGEDKRKSEVTGCKKKSDFNIEYFKASFFTTSNEHFFLYWKKIPNGSRGRLSEYVFVTGTTRIAFVMQTWIKSFLLVGWDRYVLDTTNNNNKMKINKSIFYLCYHRQGCLRCPTQERR